MRESVVGCVGAPGLFMAYASSFTRWPSPHTRRQAYTEGHLILVYQDALRFITVVNEARKRAQKAGEAQEGCRDFTASNTAAGPEPKYSRRGFEAAVCAVRFLMTCAQTIKGRTFFLCVCERACG